MTREHWQHIKGIAAGALAEPESLREAYVTSHCGADEALRGEVASLVDSASRAAHLFETPVLLIAGASAALETLSGFENRRIGERVGPYRIVRELGGGGMGAAYLAVRADEAFEKRVAIKLIKRGMDTEAVLRRFRHERQILADLDHPNIGRLLDGGTTADGLPYFVMEYVEGTPIDAYCDANRLTTAERVALFRGVCDAVQHAHDHHVVHRDLKPSNILVTGDRTPKLLDFGISKVLTPDAAAGQTEATLLSRAMTPSYASPEQVRGDAITPSTDIYSLGVLLYELLTGHRPYRLDGRTLQEIDEVICHEEPERPSVVIDRVDEMSRDDGRGPESVSATRDGRREVLRRRLAGDLDNIVLMALRKEPERRYATVRDISDDLARHLEGLPVRARGDDLGYRAARFLKRHRLRAIEVGLVVAVLAVIVSITPWARGNNETARTGGIDSIAVLPFAMVSGNPEMEYLSDGLAEGIIGSLSGFPQLKVASRNTVFRFKGSAVEPQRVARELGVRSVLLGNISETGDTLSLGLELVDGADGRRLWQEQYTGTLSSLATLREQVTHALAERLGLARAERARLAAGQTGDSEAYQLYLKGRYVWNKRTENGFQRGLEYFAQALVRDPHYALAYTGLADCYNLLGVWGTLAPHDAMPKVKDAALKAIAIDDSLAEAHTSLAFVQWVYDWDWAAADREFQRALELNPSYATAHDWYAYYLASLGRFDQAIAHIRRAQQLEPVSLSINTDVGEIYYWAGQHDRAVDALQAVLQVEPDFAMARNILGLTYLKVGRMKEALQELETANRLATGPRMLSTLAYAYGVSGSRAKARMLIESLQQLSTERYTSAFALGLAYAGAGDNDRAIAQLEQAFVERSDSMAILRVYPVLDMLHGDPRFQNLLHRVGLPPPS